MHTRTNRSEAISSDRNWEQIFDEWLTGDCFYDEPLSSVSWTTVIPTHFQKASNSFWHWVKMNCVLIKENPHVTEFPPGRRQQTLDRNFSLYFISSIRVHLHWEKVNAKANFFLWLCPWSMWTLNWILYESIWKRCRFRFPVNVN